MLILPDSNLFVYVIARDFGFAPNPFFGVCTLATCKPGIRKGAKIGDWVLGVGGKKLGINIHRKGILLMRVSNKISFDDYWTDPRYSLKKPCRNGSQLKMLGDNIYHKDKNDKWIQEDSHHSNPDGTINIDNLDRDTGTSDNVLISDLFFYFGDKAIPLDLASINYKSGLGFKKICLPTSTEGRELIDRIYSKNKNNVNCVVSDPCQFSNSHQRVDQKSGILSK
ncbi:hypothetical protein [Zhongshania sp.]|jgi:hypothetical protein|uniref:Nmad2 family putative nucleotide modification protein n=1 Tax=Zhongshania sp. TaxID=1971902 RepID=UPI0039E2CBBA